MLFLVPRFQRRAGYLVLGAVLALVGILFNRWNVTVSGLVVPLQYSPGSSLPAETIGYFPNLSEWAVGLGVFAYALTMLTLGRAIPAALSPGRLGQGFPLAPGVLIHLPCLRHGPRPFPSRCEAGQGPCRSCGIQQRGECYNSAGQTDRPLKVASAGG